MLPVDRLRRHHAATDKEIEQLQAAHDALSPEEQATVGDISDPWLEESLAGLRASGTRSVR